eukprot:15306_1
MPSLYPLIKLISALGYIHYTACAFSQTLPESCSGNRAMQNCDCFQTRAQCKSAIVNYDRNDCFWHSSHGCISITAQPTLEPTLEPTVEPIISQPNTPTQEPSITPTQSPTNDIISTLQCGALVSGATDKYTHTHWYGLFIQTPTDLFIDSCGSGYDTWLYFQQNDDTEMMIDCDDCGACSLQTQLHILDVKEGNYTVGVGGYRGNSGSYTLHITCTVTLEPTPNPTMEPTPMPTDFPTSIPTRTPTYLPTVNTYNPTVNPTYNPTSKPTIEPTFYPTDWPTPFPTPRPTPKPTAYPTVHPTLYPTHAPRPTVSPIVDVTQMRFTVESTTNMEGGMGRNTEIQLVWTMKSGPRNGMNSFEIALIVASVIIVMIVGTMFGLKYVNQYRTQHIKLSSDMYGNDEDDFLQYLDGKTNNINIEEILECYANTSLMHCTLDENTVYE